MEEYLFTKHYKAKDKIFYADIEESLVRKLTIRTVEDTYMVGIVGESDVVLIGRDKIARLHKSVLDTKRYLESLGKKANIEVIRNKPEKDGNKNK